MNTQIKHIIVIKSHYNKKIQRLNIFQQWSQKIKRNFQRKYNTYDTVNLPQIQWKEHSRPFYELDKILILKPDVILHKKEMFYLISLIDTNSKFLKQILANVIQQQVKIIINHS